VIRRRVVVLGAVALIGASCFFAHTKIEASRKRQLVGVTQAALAQYSHQLRLGLTRKEVENYLRANDTTFRTSCCWSGRHTFATVVKVGDDKPDWYCSELPVYLMFEYKAGNKPDLANPNKVNPKDVLDEIHLQTVGEGCL
jgi:hypothetical protein